MFRIAFYLMILLCLCSSALAGLTLHDPIGTQFIDFSHDNNTLMKLIDMDHQFRNETDITNLVVDVTINDPYQHAAFSSLSNEEMISLPDAQVNNTFMAVPAPGFIILAGLGGLLASKRGGQRIN